MDKANQLYVIGKVAVLPHRLAQTFMCDKPWACISITDYQEDFPEINATNRVGHLKLEFDDIERVQNRLKVFSAKQAEEILSFVKIVWPEIELLLIHCNAGSSRSSAIGMALSEIYQSEFSKLFSETYAINKRVYSTILIAAKSHDNCW